MNGRAVGELAKISLREPRLEELRTPGTVRRKENVSAVGRERTLQKIGRVTD